MSAHFLSALTLYTKMGKAATQRSLTKQQRNDMMTALVKDYPLIDKFFLETLLEVWDTNKTFFENKVAEHKKADVKKPIKPDQTTPTEIKGAVSVIAEGEPIPGSEDLIPNAPNPIIEEILA